MDVFVDLLFVSCFLLLVAVALTMLGLVGLALRWVLQVWSGRGSHRPFDWDATDATVVRTTSESTDEQSARSVSPSVRLSR
jgi:hypothetical protein